jgi:hypothetical protein
MSAPGHLPSVEESNMDVLEIPEVARLNERMLYIQQCVANAPEPEPAFLGLSHTKVRRTIARIRTGKYVPKNVGDLTPEQVADALERTLAWEVTMKWARVEIEELQRQTAALQEAALTRVMDQAVDAFFAGKELAKKQGPDSDVAKALEKAKRSWRHDFPRTRKKKRAKGKGGDGAKIAAPPNGGEGAAAP